MLKNIFITGATSGIGLSLSQELSQAGYQVFATGRNQQVLDQLTKDFGCLTAAADLSVVEQVQAVYQQAELQLGTIDILINCAGLNTRKCEIVNTELEEFEYQYAVNLRAPYLLNQLALQSMIPRKQGHIINVVSTVAKRSNPTMGIYTAMKQGLAGLNDIIMKEAQPHGIKVTALYPGGTDTAFREESRPQYMQANSVAKTVQSLLSLPEDVVIHEMTFRPMVELE